MDPGVGSEGPERPQDPDGGVECVTARGQLALFADGRISQAVDQETRKHLTTCEECLAVYRDTVASAARMGRAMRKSREDEVIRARRADVRRRVIEAGSIPRFRGLSRLRLALLPGLLIFLLLQYERTQVDRDLTVHWQAGVVEAKGVVLDESQPVELESGDWCTTAAEARARFEWELGALTLWPETQLLVEDDEDPRLRLQRGVLEVEGRCTLTTALGVVCVERGRATVSYLAGELAVECEEGSVELFTPEGRRVLGQGESTVFSSDALARKGG